MRLDKYLADMGRGTRSELKTIIRKGRVTVDGSIVRDPAFAVTEENSVALDSSPVPYELMSYIMLNKPAGVVSATEDSRETTVLSLLPTQSFRKDLFPVGRLDKDTEGLLILTNDGTLAHRLLSPKRHVDKTYFALLDGPVGEREKALFAGGLEICDSEPFTALPAELLCLDEASCRKFAGGSFPADRPNPAGVLVTIREGKYHQVKRMFAAVGHQVLYLKRLSMGPLQLDDSLKGGEWRRLSEDEIKELKAL